MVRKDVTPKQKSSTSKKFGVSLLGGILGGMLVIGGNTLIQHEYNNNAPTTSHGVKNDNGETVASPVKVDTTSNVTDAVEKVQDAVVSIINLQGNAPQSDLSSLFGLQQQQGEDSALQPAGEGSGVIYKKEGNTAYIVTNNHVVEGQKALDVVLKDGSKAQAKLVGTDAYTDLAVLTISADTVDTVATFGDSSKLKVGEPAIAIGSPLGSQYANSVTQGIISSLNRQVMNKTENGSVVSINAIQTDAAINPGNSGGPLINIAGQIIGINSSKIATTSTATSGISVEGMGFAIPSNDVLDIIKQLEADGKVTRPALGVSLIDLSNISTQQQEQTLKVPASVKQGVIVANVGNVTPAEKAGLKQYDVITKIDGKEISNGTDLRNELYKKKVGDSVEVTFYREAKEQTVKVELSLDQETNQTNTERTR